MMAANDLSQLRRTLDDLGYYQEIDPVSVPLVSQMLHDFQRLSEYCVSHEFSTKNQNAALTTGNLESDESVVLQATDSAKNLINSLKADLEATRLELSRSKASSNVLEHPYIVV